MPPAPLPGGTLSFSDAGLVDRLYFRFPRLTVGMTRSGSAARAKGLGSCIFFVDYAVDGSLQVDHEAENAALEPASPNFESYQAAWLSLQDHVWRTERRLMSSMAAMMRSSEFQFWGDADVSQSGSKFVELSVIIAANHP